MKGHVRGAVRRGRNPSPTGHSSVAITLDTYSHVLPTADEHIAHTLASVILDAE